MPRPAMTLSMPRARAATRALLLLLVACTGDAPTTPSPSTGAGGPSQPGTQQPGTQQPGTQQPGPTPPPANTPVDSARRYPLHVPTGARFALPAGVTIEGPIVGYPKDWSRVPPDHPCLRERQPVDWARIPVIQVVGLCFTFRNSTSQPITVRFPPGIIFVSKRVQTQNGVVVYVTPIVVPANGERVVWLAMPCANEERRAPGNDDEFTIGPVSDHRAVRALTDTLATRTFDQRQYGEIVQPAIWALSLRGDASDAEIARILAPVSALPRRAGTAP